MATSRKSVAQPTQKSNGNQPKGAAESPGQGARADGSGTSSIPTHGSDSPPKR